MADKPNILVFLTDDHGQWAAHCYGTAELHTPNMDRLAQAGVRMTRAFTPSPVCSPARASFFTGLYPSQHGIHDWIDEADATINIDGHVNIAHLLGQVSYETALIGKWHCGHSRRPAPGFDRWFSFYESQYPHCGTQQFSNEGELVIEEGHQSPFITQRVVDFLETRDASRPFFACVGYVNTHSPFSDQAERLAEHYRHCSFDDVPVEPFNAVHGEAVWPAPGRDDEQREQLAQYYAAVSMIDEQIGVIVDQLERTGQLDNTLIVYTSDHGHMCGHHGMWCKGNASTPQNFLDESVRVPCLLSWPAGIAQGVVRDEVVDHCDLFATLLEAAGSSVPAEIRSPGRSYLPLLTGAVGGWEKTAQICEYGNARMIRTEQYKLIRRYPSNGRAYGDEFYDLQAEPRETVNRIGDPALAGMIEAYTAVLDEFFAGYEMPDKSGKNIDAQPVFNTDMPWARQRTVL